MVLFFLFACESVKDADDSADTTQVEDGELVDVYADLEESDCEGVNGQPVPGATSYFWGEFTISEEQITGEERWIFLANDAWEDLGEGDCEIVWNVIGSVSEPTGCMGCNFAMVATATLNTSQTTCPEGLTDGAETLQEQYDVFQAQDGTAQWYFSGSGSQFASGYFTDSQMNYISEPACKYF